jgi:hypothetical protein
VNALCALDHDGGWQYAIRPSYIDPRARLEDVDGLIDAVLRLGPNEAASHGRASSASD